MDIEKDDKAFLEEMRENPNEFQALLKFAQNGYFSFDTPDDLRRYERALRAQKLFGELQHRAVYAN